MKVIVGTANFKKEYGCRRVKAKNIYDILDSAYDLGIDTIETAHDYDCLNILENYADVFDIIYKCDTENELNEARLYLGHKVIPMKHHKPYDGWDNRSIYNPSEGYIGMIEFPYNLIDQRFGNYLYEPSENIARSVFIQGLAFGMPDFHGIPFYHVCWNFVRNNPNIDAIVVGVDTVEQLKDIMTIPNYEIDYSNIGGDGWIRTL